MTRTEIKIKPHQTQFGMKEVFKNGEKIAEYDFNRYVTDRDGRKNVRTSGHVTYTDGRTFRIDNVFWWDKDVQKAFRDGTL